MRSKTLRRSNKSKMSKKLQKNKRVSRVKRIKKNKRRTRRTKRTQINRKKKTLKGGMMFGGPKYAYINKEDAVFYKLDNPDEELVGLPENYKKNMRIVYMFDNPLGVDLRPTDAQAVADNREKAKGENKVLIKFQISDPSPFSPGRDGHAWMNKDDLVQFENPSWTQGSYGQLYETAAAASSSSQASSQQPGQHEQPAAESGRPA